MLQAFGLSDKGRVRPTNEDCFGVDPDLDLCVVADGMGGHNGGEIAARMAVEAVTEYVRRFHTGPDCDTWPFGFDPTVSDAGNLLRTAVTVASLQILEAAGTSSDLVGMGTTVVAALARGGQLTVAHVGDSRLYLYANGQLRQVTNDDSWVESMLAQDPQADRESLQHHPLRHALTNVVGARTGTKVHVAELPLPDGAVIVLTTDGVHGVLDERCLERLIANLAPDRPDTEELPARLMAAALANGSRDNCTAVVARYLNQASCINQTTPQHRTPLLNLARF